MIYKRASSEKKLKKSRPNCDRWITKAIVSGMIDVVEVTNVEDTAYWGFVKMRMQKAKAFDSFQNQSELSQSLKLIDSLPMPSETTNSQNNLTSFQSEEERNTFAMDSINSQEI